VPLNASGNWQYIEDDITVPSNCAQVQGSPRVQATNFNAAGILHMDYAIFAPFRAAIAVGAHGKVRQSLHGGYRHAVFSQ